MGKKLPKIHSKIVVKINKTGPVKKKIPLFIRIFLNVANYTTASNVVAPPKPMRIIENVAVAIAKLPSI